MPSNRERKEEAEKVYEQLIRELGENEVKRRFEETERELEASIDPSIPWEDVA